MRRLTTWKRRTMTTPKQPTESKTDFAVRLFDTSDPPMTYYRAAKLAGINPVTLYQRLRLRERLEATICPLCGRYPGQKASRPGDRRLVPLAPAPPQDETESWDDTAPQS